MKLGIFWKWLCLCVNSLISVFLTVLEILFLIDISVKVNTWLCGGMQRSMENDSSAKVLCALLLSCVQSIGN